MVKREIQNFFNDKKQSVTIDLLYARNKNKGVTKDFVETLVYQDQKEAIKLLNQAHTLEEFQELIRANFDKLCTRYGFIFTFYITGGICGMYEGGRDLVCASVGKRILDCGVLPSDLSVILEEYQEVLTQYINRHNEIKHKLLKADKMHGTIVADFTEKFDEKSFMEVGHLLFKPVNDVDYYRKAEMLKLVCSLLAVYNKDTLLYKTDFVKYEIEYGYFDQYYEMLSNRVEIPSLDERELAFQSNCKITSEQQYRLDKLDLLEKRISLLRYPSKVIFLEKIKQIREETDLQRKVELVDACFDYYEKEYRKEIVESSFSPESSLEVSDYRTLNPAMLHLFLRDPMKKLGEYEKQVKSDILAKRGVKVTGVEELTLEEMQEFQTSVDYAINVLLNPVVTSKSLEGKSLYSDSTGLRWYKSDTSNQISISLFSPDEIMYLPNCVGVGFDQTSVDPSNIIISSNYYQTTNMGVDNLEVDPMHRFESFSAPLAELCQSRKTEIVMYRDKDGIKTEASYVFAVVNGLDEKKDRETILQAKEYVEKNQVKLVVFNTKKLKQSYEAMFQEEVTEDMEVKASKTL